MSFKSNLIGILVCLLFSSIVLAEKEKKKVAFIGTFKSSFYKDGKLKDRTKFESLPKQWNKNSNFYEALLLNDPQAALDSSKWKAQIDIIKNQAVVKSLNFNPKASKKVGQNYFLTSFKKIINSGVQAPYIVQYSLTLADGKKLIHQMEVQAED